ncbi:hypothetical protein TrVE_jg11160 [Triparma verrucosa]|uniref:Uncharacterized protein n=1 Tax=Triparma verrucosa TaxID=1606542 RepID=A0A9W7BCK1_9STRA|nr:hypothetical protein TrVE_jg11160 [Triparma verrucosa]
MMFRLLTVLTAAFTGAFTASFMISSVQCFTLQNGVTFASRSRLAKPSLAKPSILYSSSSSSSAESQGASSESAFSPSSPPQEPPQVTPQVTSKKINVNDCTYTLNLPSSGIPLITFPGSKVPPILTKWFDETIRPNKDLKEGTSTIPSPKDYVSPGLFLDVISPLSTLTLSITSSPPPPPPPPTPQPQPPIPTSLSSDVLLSSTPQTLIDLESDPLQKSKPRTPQSIKEAYDSKVSTGAVNIQAPGWGGFLDRIKSGYFFGFFEAAEDSLRNPDKKNTNSWLLRPSITFPLAFATVGLAFAVMVEGGGIRERGEVRRDELDEVVLRKGEGGGEEEKGGWFN